MVEVEWRWGLVNELKRKHMYKHIYVVHEKSYPPYLFLLDVRSVAKLSCFRRVHYFLLANHTRRGVHT